ncbi:uncharacterized protein, partial [Elaeis guineensis]|uniref:uncharacterized protein n=1 Tax=Elaeis guineensis var. tenera TaxID=51953 RepID=UPI003C6CFBB4
MDRTLLHAATSGDVDALKRVAERGANLLDGKTPFGNTALHIAVTFKRQQFIEDICVRRPALLGRRNVNGETPLHLAEILGSHEAVVFFLEHAGPLDVEPAAAPDVEPVAAPDVELAVAPPTGVQALLRAVDRYGNNTLHVALLNGHVGVAKKLVSADPGLAAHINQNDESPLYLAAMRGFLEIVQLLLVCVPCDHRGPRGQTAMHAAVSGGHQGSGFLYPQRSKTSS